MSNIHSYGNDIVDTSRLPPIAQEALEALRERVSDIRDLLEAASRKRERAREDRDEADRDFRNRVRTHRLAEGHSLYDELKRKFDKAHKNFMDAQDRDTSIGERWQSQKRLLTRVETYVTLLRTSTSQAPAPSIKVPADRLLPDIEKLRNEIASHSADRHETLCKATPSAEIKVRLRAEVEELVRRGRPDVTRMVDNGPGEGVAWPDYEAIARGSGIGVPLPGDVGHTRFVQAPHLPLLAWLFRDRLIEALEAEIDANADDAQSLSLEARTKKLAEIDARILAAERVEVAMVRHAGIAVDYREDTDPRALLGIEGPPSNED
ncbi:hypothetical protein [Rhizobium sp. N4311]|uniref:hypothetical protein n=1 Tax=Rhizobium sp. N4311 TaxID=1703972 RepID=UPI000B96D67E|nr:hypothetical protein [Rhizobium sp. N4311]OYD05785.1 hypothetical protein AMK08_CH103856 [Rhizobium sp. N4311]